LPDAMLAGQRNIEHRSDAMELRRIIPTDITASAIAHVSLLTLLLLFSEVHPFGAVTAEQIPVEIVTPQELAEKQAPPDEPPAENKPEPAPTPQPDFSLLDKPAAVTPSPPTAQPAPAARPQKQAALATPPTAQPPSQPVAQPPSQPAAPAYKPPEPDVSIKYQVLLGLPPDLSPMPPAPARAHSKGDDNFDAPATDAADIASTVIAAFRRHLKTCSKLPASLSGTDDVKVKLRVLMTPDGRLAAEPILIEASASMKGPLLMQGAVRALQACQPYAMLPADRYGEWKVLDLSFTPQDFSAS
jgi:outer membrane biosynthesis protein TonB